MNRILEKTKGPFVQIFVGASLVSFTSVLVKLANVGPTVSAFYRMFFSAILLFIIVYWQKGEIRVSRKAFRWPFLAAFFFALDLFFWHRSIIFVGPGLATLLGNCQVFFVAIAAFVFLKERFTWQRGVSIPVAVLGLYLVMGVGWSNETDTFKLGVTFGLLTALSYAVYILVLRNSQSDSESFRLSVFLNMAYIGLFAAVMLGSSALIEGESFFIPDLQTWASLLGLAVVGQVLGWVLISKGLPKVDASVGGIALLIQPALAFVWDILFFHRPTTAIEFVGVGITLAAIYFGSMGGKKELSKTKTRQGLES